MKKILLLSGILLSLFACKKGSGDRPTNTSLSSITVVNPLAHTMNIQSFQFNDGLLTSYTDKTIDSNGGINWESRTYRFNYMSGSNLPYSVDFIDTTREVGSVNGSQGETMGLVYDNSNRLILDTFVASYPGAYVPKVYYRYSGDSLIFGQGPVIPGSYFLIPDGNITTMGGYTYTYSNFANPLKTTSIAKTFAPFFFGGLIGLYMDSYALPVDFISNDLPSMYTDGNGHNTTFTWTKDSKGRVKTGTATNMYWYANAINGPISITFTYQ